MFLRWWIPLGFMFSLRNVSPNSESDKHFKQRSNRKSLKKKETKKRINCWEISELHRGSKEKYTSNLSFCKVWSIRSFVENFASTCETCICDLWKAITLVQNSILPEAIFERKKSGWFIFPISPKKNECSMGPVNGPVWLMELTKIYIRTFFDLFVTHLVSFLFSFCTKWTGRADFYFHEKKITMKEEN